jgi:hypothetical protein
VTERQSVCVCVRERERERECVCVCACASCIHLLLRGGLGFGGRRSRGHDVETASAACTICAQRYADAVCVWA